MKEADFKKAFKQTFKCRNQQACFRVFGFEINSLKWLLLSKFINSKELRSTLKLFATDYEIHTNSNNSNFQFISIQRTLQNIQQQQLVLTNSSTNNNIKYQHRSQSS